MLDRPTHLFVYGTLRRGSKNKFARLLHAHAQFVGKGRIPGRLYRLGHYPGAVLSNTPGEWVHGELYLIPDPRWTLPALDSYEGPEQFERVKLQVQLDSGDRVEAWVYLYRGTPRGARIPSGDWLRS
jgi:gamma-glutamylcyclotransferase (GGCT)/AIG2-like uncharacterized protein YtfP